MLIHMEFCFHLLLIANVIKMLNFAFISSLSLQQFFATVMKSYSNRKLVEQLNQDEETPELVSFFLSVQILLYLTITFMVLNRHSYF